jgi:hypothetical protein
MLARDGAAEESGDVVVRDDARQDLKHDVVRQQRGRGGCRPFLLPTGGHANSVDAIGRGKMQIGGFILGVCVKLRHTKVYPTLSFPVSFISFPCVHVTYTTFSFPFFFSGSVGLVFDRMSLSLSLLCWV